MAKCFICGDEVQVIKARDKHLIITKGFVDQHIHLHGEIDDKELMREMLETVSGELGMSFATQVLARKEIVFHNRQRIGDMLMFTCGVRDFKRAFPNVRVNVISIAMHIWDNNPYIDKTLVATPENTLKIGPGKLTNASNRLDWHFANAFRVSIEDALKVHISQGESRPDIWLTEEEYNAPRVIKQPYWTIVLNGEKGWGCKMYPFERWQAFVNQNPDVTFVQIGTNEDNPPRLQGANVIDYVGKTQDKNTGIRDLFKLFLNAEGSIGLVSFHMHLSGALNKPSIVVAGAREPVSFTRYPAHQYLATDGCLPCAVNACWHCDIDKCTNLVIGKEKVPKCVDIIYPEDLTRALNQYYLGGRLKKGIPSEKPKLKNIVKAEAIVIPPVIAPEKPVATITPSNGKYIKLVSTARGWGGCARSTTTIMKFLLKAGHKVEFIPFRNKVGSNEFQQFLKQYPEIIVTENYDTLKEGCDVLFMYADDYIWEFGQPFMVEAFSNLNADKKIMMLNYRRGAVGEIPWTLYWDKYMFLNSTQEKELIEAMQGNICTSIYQIKTKVLPPCTELEEFLKVVPDYNKDLHIVRHSSQGDVKFPKNIEQEIEIILNSRQHIFIDMLPGPSFVNLNGGFTKHPRTADPKVIAEFLSRGNLFWYSLPEGYMDQGPRVILEAMASGLPILADNWGGVVDRITPECGWLCDSKEQMVEIIKNVTREELQRKGQTARERAKAEFIPERWIQEILI